MGPRLTPLTIVLLSCHPVEVHCRTACGIELRGTAETRLIKGTFPPNWSCEELQEAESLALHRYEQETASLDPRFANACPKLKGWGLYVETKDSWLGVSGETFCPAMNFSVNNPPVMSGSFVHELAHVIQRCDPQAEVTYCATGSNGLPVPCEDYDHTGWRDRNIYKVIDSLMVPQ